MPTIHTHNPFADIIKSVSLSLSKGIVAQEAYDMITDILHRDNGFDDLPIADRKKQRQTALQAKVDAYFAWVKNKYSQITHNSTSGKPLPTASIRKKSKVSS